MIDPVEYVNSLNVRRHAISRACPFPPNSFPGLILHAGRMSKYLDKNKTLDDFLDGCAALTFAVISC